MLDTKLFTKMNILILIAILKDKDYSYHFVSKKQHRSVKKINLDII